jgi:hypothetical protein
MFALLIRRMWFRSTGSCGRCEGWTRSWLVLNNVRVETGNWPGRPIPSQTFKMQGEGSSSLRRSDSIRISRWHDLHGKHCTRIQTPSRSQHQENAPGEGAAGAQTRTLQRLKGHSFRGCRCESIATPPEWLDRLMLGFMSFVGLWRYLRRVK